MRAAGALLAALRALACQAGLAKLPEMLQARLGKENIEKPSVFIWFEAIQPQKQQFCVGVVKVRSILPCKTQQI